MTLLLTSDEGHHINRHFTHVNVTKVGLEILFLVFKTSRIVFETELGFSFFLSLRHNRFSI